MSGNLWLFIDASFSFDRAVAYSEPATIFSFDGNNSLISSVYDGAEFVLPGVAASENSLVLAVPADDAGPASPTLLRVDTRESVELTLPLMNRDVLDEIYLSLTAQSALDPQLAQVVYQVLDAELDPLAGISLSLPGAEFVAYADGLSFSDALDSTGDQGLAIFGNIPAAELPGSSIGLSLSGAVVGQQVLNLVRGAVSYEVVIAE